MRRYLPLFIIAAVGLLTLGTGMMLYRAKRPPVLTIPKDSAAAETAGTESIHVRGEANAPVTLEEFGDFQCPLCGKLAGPTKQLEEAYGSQLRVIFRQFPLPVHVHAHAQEAALVSEAAGFQGRFWEMHDLLYREQEVWSKVADARALFRAYAGMLGLDLDRFGKDMDGAEAKERVASDQKRGTALGVNRTPTMFVNNRQIPAPLEVAGLRTAIDAALKPQPSP
jgi:formate-nitrite transporter family protein